MNDLLPWIISLVAGAVGGNVAGALMKNISLGTIGNSLSGILGGGLGAGILKMIGFGAAAEGAVAGGALDLQSILGSVASGGVGGGVVMAIIGFIKNAMAKK